MDNKYDYITIISVIIVMCFAFTGLGIIRSYFEKKCIQNGGYPIKDYIGLYSGCVDNPGQLGAE